MSDLAIKEDNKRVEVAFSASGVQLRSMDEMGRFCRAIVNSGLAPSSFQTPEQVMVAIRCRLCKPSR
jgi:hypothetical protein